MPQLAYVPGCGKVVLHCPLDFQSPTLVFRGLPGPNFTAERVLVEALEPLRVRGVVRRQPAEAFALVPLERRRPPPGAGKKSAASSSSPFGVQLGEDVEVQEEEPGE